MMTAESVVWTVLRAVLVVFALLALAEGAFGEGAGALALLAFGAWVRLQPPAYVGELLESRAGLELRRALVVRVVGELLALAHALGLPAEVLGALMVEVGAELQRGRAPELLAEIHALPGRRGGDHG